MNTLPALRIDRRDHLGRVRLLAVGKIDVQTAPELRQRLVEVGHHDGDVVLDLVQVEQLDGFGVGVIIEAARRARDRGYVLMVVRADGGRVAGVLADAGIDRLAAVADATPE